MTRNLIASIIISLLLFGCEIFHSERKEISVNRFPTEQELNTLFSDSSQSISFAQYPPEGMEEYAPELYPAQYEITGLTYPSFLLCENYGDKHVMVLYHHRRAQIPEDERKEIATEFDSISQILEDYLNNKD